MIRLSEKIVPEASPNQCLANDAVSRFIIRWGLRFTANADTRILYIRRFFPSVPTRKSQRDTASNTPSAEKSSSSRDFIYAVENKYCYTTKSM